MAKSANIIQMEFGKAEEQARNLDQIANDMNRLADDTLAETLAGIKSAWNSNNSAEYIKKGQRVQEELKKRAQELKNTASVIRQISRNTYEAEMNALRMITQRKH